MLSAKWFTFDLGVNMLTLRILRPSQNGLKTGKSWSRDKVLVNIMPTGILDN